MIDKHFKFMIIYKQRRQRVLDLLAHTQSVALIGTAPEFLRNRDNSYPYRHDSYFYYLTGFTEPEAFLVLDGRSNASSQATLFCREKNESLEIWHGRRYGPEVACELFGFDAAYPITLLDQKILDYLADLETLYYPLGSIQALDCRLHQWLNTLRQKTRSGTICPTIFYDLYAVLDEMRVIKDPHELKIMRTAAQISAQAHRRAMQKCTPGLFEYQLEAELYHEFYLHGARAPAYEPIVASGENACILHYRENNAQCRDGDLCLIDAGCEFESYAADITRTFPVNGQFNAAQRALYELVAAAQQAAIDQTRIGCHFNQPHEAALGVLAQGFLDLGLLSKQHYGSVDAVLESKAYQQFYMHRTGHWLGMDVHDCGAYSTVSGRLNKPRVLEENMVLTIEPGVYVRPNAAVDPRYWHIGIRIEDDALVTQQGCELLTRAVPVDVGEIERLMKEQLPCDTCKCPR